MAYNHELFFCHFANFQFSHKLYSKNGSSHIILSINFIFIIYQGIFVRFQKNKI